MPPRYAGHAPEPFPVRRGRRTDMITRNSSAGRRCPAEGYPARLTLPGRLLRILGRGTGGAGRRPARWLGLDRARGCLIYAVFLGDAVHLAPQARWVCGCRSGAAGLLLLFGVAGRRSEPRRDRATASVSPPLSRPTVSTTMSGMLPVLSP